MKYREGDKVVVSAGKRELSGIVMPSKGSLVLKLDSGYNVGIRKQGVKGIKVVGRVEQGKRKAKKTVARSGLPKVVIISTGGTISSRVDYTTGAVHAALDAGELLEMNPELGKVASIECRFLMNKMSEDMNPADWSKMAKAIYGELADESVSGVVLTHGTDTMHYTSSALSFMLGSLNKPVVITGSQRSSDRGSSDSSMNLLCSMILATSDMAEVMVCMHGTTDDSYCLAHRGTKVRKMHTSARDAFRTINGKPLARVYPDGRVERLETYRKRSECRVKLDAKVENRVALIQTYPGMKPEVLGWYAKSCKGIVLAGTGLGHIGSGLVPEVRKAVKKGIIVCVAPQCINGRVNLNVYSNGRKLLEAGALPLGDMLPETALVKLMWVLGHGGGKEEMAENIAGETTRCTVYEASTGG